MQQDFKRPSQTKAANAPQAEGELPTPVVEMPPSIRPESVASTPAVPSVANETSDPDNASQSYAAVFKKQKSTKSKMIVSAVLAFIAVIAMALAAAGVWYFLSLEPKNPQASQKRVIIQQGTTLADMASQLEREGIIKDALAFQVYIRTQGLQAKMQAGAYVLSPAQSVPDIVTTIVDGKVDAFSVTILPGLTLKELKESLLDYGFSERSIDTAFVATYDHPLLKSKPKTSSLEGYIHPDTYEIDGSGTVEDLLKRSFDELYDKVQKEQIEQKLAAQKLSLHQGIILSSIVQKEVSDTTDQKQVAQVFLKRLKEDIELGSDVTFIYAAEQLGVEPTVGLDSPYNTRKNKGLPPGPIANFNFDALQAVASPAPGDFLYFVAGDDGKTYFGRTLEEHERNIKEHCIELCKLF